MERRRRGFLELLEVLNEGGRGGDVVEFMGVEAEFVGGGRGGEGGGWDELALHFEKLDAIFEAVSASQQRVHSVQM